MAAIITAMTYCDESAKAKAELAELKTLDKNRANEYERLKISPQKQHKPKQSNCALNFRYCMHFNRRQRFGKNAGISNALDAANQNLHWVKI